MHLPVLALKLASSAELVRHMTELNLLGSGLPAGTADQLSTYKVRTPVRVVYRKEGVLSSLRAVKMGLKRLKRMKGSLRFTFLRHFSFSHAVRIGITLSKPPRSML